MHVLCEHRRTFLCPATLALVGQKPTCAEASQFSAKQPQSAVTVARRATEVAAGLLLGLSLHSALGQEGKAVEVLNGSAGADWTYSDGPYTTIQSYGASAALNVPLWRFLGGSVFASSYRERFKADYSDLLLGDPYAASRGDSVLGAALFLRTPELGRLGVNYRETVQSNQFAYAGDLQAYLTRWTVAAGVERAGIKDVRTSPTTTDRFADNTYLVGASFYPLDELRLDARANVFERDVGRIYTAAVEWLPAFLGIPISARFAYSHVTGDVIFATNNTYGLSITYFFAPTLSLLTLDRAFR
jgi:hypothetical protein